MRYADKLLLITAALYTVERIASDAMDTIKYCTATTVFDRELHYWALNPFIYLFALLAAIEYYKLLSPIIKKWRREKKNKTQEKT